MEFTDKRYEFQKMRRHIGLLQIESHIHHPGNTCMCIEVQAMHL